LLRSSQFQPHINRTTKSAAIAQAESVFIAVPKKTPTAEDFDTRAYRESEEKMWEDKIAKLRMIREAALDNNPPG
jgi:hypothetical protein